MKRLYSFIFILSKPLLKEQIWDGAAALSFYLILSLFPGVIVLLGLASYLPLQESMAAISDYVLVYFPNGQLKLFQSVVDDISGKDQFELLSFGFLFALWTATTGVGAIIRQLNLVYQIKERRNLIKIRLLSVGIALAMILSFLLSFLIIVIGQGLSSLLVDFKIIPWSHVGLSVIRYMIAGTVVFFIFGIINVLGPNRKKYNHTVVPGSLISSVMFLLSSYLFSFYLAEVTDYSATYGSIGTVIGLLMWLYLFSISLLLGAEFNNSLESKRDENP